MQRFEPFPFVVAFASESGEVFEILSRAVSSVSFNVAEGWYRGSNPAGAFEIFDVEEGDPQPIDCPFGGALTGFVGLDPWERDTFEWIVERSLHSGRGFVLDRRTGARCDSAICKTLTLRQVVGRHGFSEGAELLESSERYDAYVRAKVAQALRPFDLRPWSYHAGDHPHILDGFEGDDRSRADHWAKFERLADTVTLNLWVANFQGLRSWFAGVAARG